MHYQKISVQQYEIMVVDMQTTVYSGPYYHQMVVEIRLVNLQMILKTHLEVLINLKKNSKEQQLVVLDRDGLGSFLIMVNLLLQVHQTKIHQLWKEKPHYLV